MIAHLAHWHAPQWILAAYWIAITAGSFGFSFLDAFDLAVPGPRQAEFLARRLALVALLWWSGFW